VHVHGGRDPVAHQEFEFVELVFRRIWKVDVKVSQTGHEVAVSAVHRKRSSRNFHVSNGADLGDPIVFDENRLMVQNGLRVHWNHIHVDEGD